MGESDSHRNIGAQIRDWLRVLRERAYLILFCIVLTTAAAITYSNVRAPVYSATSRLLVEDESTNALFGSGANQYVDPNRRTATDVELVSLPAVATRVVRELRLPYSPQVLLGKVKTESQGDSSIISIGVEDTNAGAAAAIANSFARQYIEFRKEADQRRFTRALALVRSQIADREALGSSASTELKALRSQAEQLQLLASVQTGGIQLIQPAQAASSPIRPKKLRNAILGVIFGLLLGIALATLRDKLDRRVKDEGDVRRLLPEIPVIATVPRATSGPRGRAATLEGYRTLQTNLSFLDLDRNLRSFLVTSAMLGDGKSTTSLHLGFSMLERERSALLVEADLRRPGLSARIGLLGAPGVSNFLSGTRPLNDFIIDITDRTAELLPHAEADGLPPTGDTLAMVPAGPIPPNPQALLSSARLDELLIQGLQAADTVVVDGTPVGAFSDMLPIAKRVDGVIIVVRLYHTRRPEIERLVEQLEQAAVTPIGVVVLGAPLTSTDDYYTASHARVRAAR
jgi:polysaccharide biosynthesis transport protein